MKINYAFYIIFSATYLGILLQANKVPIATKVMKINKEKLKPTVPMKMHYLELQDFLQ